MTNCGVYGAENPSLRLVVAWYPRDCLMGVCFDALQLLDPCSAVKLKSEILETALALDLEHHRIARLQFAER